MATRTKKEKTVEPVEVPVAARLRAKLQAINDEFWREPMDKGTRVDQIAMAMQDGFGCYHKISVRIIEALSGEKLPSLAADRNDNGYVVGLVIVPVTNPNGHDYDLDKPAVVVSNRGSQHNRGAWRTLRKSTGNNIPSQRHCYRPPTKDEIASSLDSFLEWVEMRGATAATLATLEKTVDGVAVLFTY